MDAARCHAPGVEQAKSAKDIVYKVIGLRRTADYCGVSESAIYQWFSRKNEAEPIPPRHVGPILKGAARDGIADQFDPRILWPGMPGQVAA